MAHEISVVRKYEVECLDCHAKTITDTASEAEKAAMGHLEAGMEESYTNYSHTLRIIETTVVGRHI